MVRLIDIAERAGVSPGTVSAVLSGRGNSIRFSKEKAEKIRAIAREMNYIPNFSAKMLSGQSSHTLGVLIDSGDVAVRYEQLAAIDQAAERRGYRLLIAEAHANAEKLLLNHRTLLQYGVDGVICHANSVHESLRTEKNVVFYGAEPFDGIPAVYYDIEAGYRQALAQFRQEGRKRPALVMSWDIKRDSIRARHRAFHNLEDELSGGLFTLNWGKACSSDVRAEIGTLIDEVLLPKKIDALIMQNDLLALSLLFELQLRGIPVPQAISVVGQDNSPFCNYTRPALSTIDSNLDGLGNAVMELMLERLEHPELPIRSVGIPTLLVNRDTTLARQHKEKN